MLFRVAIAFACLFIIAGVAGQPAGDTALAVQQTIAPVTSLIATNHEYDNGTGIDLIWVPSIDDRLAPSRVTGYEVWRSVVGGSGSRIAELPAGANKFTDEQCSRESTYVYSVVAISVAGNAVSISTAPIQPAREWINLHRLNLLAIAFLVSAAVIYFIQSARSGKKLFVRKIAGLDAVDDAIGRATEMGRPILFIPGIQDMDDVQTIAAITILGRVSRVVADYDTKIKMPVSRSLVMTAARETIKASYMAAGRPDAYNDDMVSYVTDEQFGYVAAVDGIMVREKPATCFYLGAFFAESLILAETGNSVGAIQIAGTAMPAQIPFFVAACDFALIGEELFAASAYLSNEPKQLGSLKGQDVGKAVALVVIVVGTMAATIGSAWDVTFMNQLWSALKVVFQTN
ncbi:MAG: hypothetical protein HY851_03100 [candidate division Zixibacteria bacterium]|nr:hypothetical protein [candidate division Zixibacteria bacterium]